jgi:hypothetical protein
MMKRPRLRRYFCVSMLAIAGLLVLSYFPLSRIRAANAGATILPSAGKPLVNLKNPQGLKVSYIGSADAVAALQGGTASPTALAEADFNADGAMDVVAGYSIKTSGLLVLFRGNPDAYAPTDLTLYGKAAKGNVSPTFLPKAAVFTVPQSPDLLVTGDFNRDGYKDLLVGTRGAGLYLLAGDGQGNLLAPQAVPLTGQIMALAVTGDGHVAVSVDGPSGPQLVILAPSSEGLTAAATYPLPAQGGSVAWGNLGGGADVAVGAGTNVVMVYRALTANAQTEIVTVPFQVQGLALGDFIWDRDGRTEIGVLADDGSIHILQHGTPNTTPITAAELPARRAALRGRHAKSTTPPNPTALGAWTLAGQLPYAGSAPAGPVSPSAFNSPRVAQSSTQDLMVLDAGRSQLNILDTSGKTASPSAGVSFSAAPVAALALPQKINSDRDIVVLTSSQAAPLLVTSGASVTLNVNTTADIDTINACTTNTTSIPSTLSLREAVCLANNYAPDTATINIPAGTYDLASVETGELQIETSGTAYSLTINGTGTASNTIIQQTDGKDRIFEEDYALAGSNPVTIENLTLAAGNCTTGTDCEYGGGAVLAGGIAGDDVTVTNVVMNDNTGEQDGGALNFAGPNLTITNSTFSNNYANGNGVFNEGVGGGVYFLDQGAVGGTANGFLTITNSSFTSNRTNGGSGGGLWAEVSTGDPLTITGSTFTGNQAAGGGGTYDGGGIYAEQSGETATTVTVSNSRIVGNSATGSGNGAYVAEATANLQNSWWGCNAGPGNTGCDSVFISSGGGFTPVLTLSLSATSNTVSPSGTTTLTAKLNNSGTCTGYIGNACYVPDGAGATFSGGSLGTAVPGSTTFAGGVATSTFEAGATTGTTTASVTVDNQTEDVTIDIGTPPAFTSNNSTTFTVGTNSSFSVTASGPPAPTVTQTGGSLPNGVGFSSGTGSGTLSGTPAAGTGGVYTLDFQAANGFLPNANQSFTLTVDQAPVFTSSGTAVFPLGSASSFPVTASGYPSPAITESGTLPTGVTFTGGTGSASISGTPTQAGTFNITLFANNGVGTQASQAFILTVPKVATSINVTSVSPASEVYGLDSAVTITAVLSWTGSGPAPTASDVTIGGNGPSGYSATTCGSPSGDTLTCSATYTPTAADTVGTYTESASFSGDNNYSGSSSPQTNNFSITQASSTTSVASSQNPSVVGQSVTFTATIDGEYGLIVRRNGVLVSGGASVIKRGASQRSLTQKGQAQPQSIGGTVTWSSNTGCSPSAVSGDPGTSQCVTSSLPQGTDTITATYSGDGNHSGSTGTLNGGQVVNGQAELSIKPTSINFGTAYLHNLNDRNVTVTNIGSSSVTISSVSLTLGSGTNKGDFTFVNLCPRTLEPGKSCVINVIFFSGNIGSLSATLNVSDNAAGSPQQVSLSATVINPQASFSPSGLNFGTIEVGHSSTKNVTLTNKGTTALNITSIGITGGNEGDYTQSNTCPSSLAAGSDCIISVTFTPSATGTRSADLTVIDNAEISKQNVPLTGKGSQ